MAKREVVIFLAILLLLIAIGGAIFVYNLPPIAIIAIAVVVIAGSFISPRLVEFKEYERGVKFRFGKFRKVVGPGWIFYWPSFENFVPVDLRTAIVDLPKQQVITRDDVEIKVDAIIYEKVVDPKKAVIVVKDYKVAMRELLRSQVRNTVSKMELEEVLERTEEVGNELLTVLKSVAEEWGIAVMKVEVQAIELPPSLIEAMHKRRAAGEYKIKLEIEAQAKQLSLDILDKATSKMSDNTLKYLYMDALKTMSQGRATKILFPVELSKFASALSQKFGGDANAIGTAVAALASLSGKKPKS